MRRKNGIILIRYSQYSINELEAKEAELKKTNGGALIPESNAAINCHQNENEMHAQNEPSPSTSIFDTRELFRCQQE